MVANDPHVPARVIAGRYRLGSRMGSSLEAAAFEAFDEQLQRTVVLKLVHPDLGDLPAVQRAFRAQMPAAAGLHHPNLATVHDFGSARWNDREVLYVASERLTGGSLRDILDRGRLLSPSQSLLVGLDACKALDAIHRQGLIHTDVRPSTLVFGDDRRLRVIDVGLAQVLHDAAGDVTGRTVDRAKYSSPEEAQGAALAPKSDVYSLCLTLLEAVTGGVPFVGDSAVATLANRVDKLMPVSADLGPLAAVLERAGRPEADDRYTAAGFGRALVQAAEKMPRPAPLPILSQSLFAMDRTEPGQPVEPTGPLQRPVQPAEPAEAVAVTPEAPAQPNVEAPSGADIAQPADTAGLAVTPPTVLPPMTAPSLSAVAPVPAPVPTAPVAPVPPPSLTPLTQLSPLTPPAPVAPPASSQPAAPAVSAPAPVAPSFIPAADPAIMPADGDTEVEAPLGEDAAPLDEDDFDPADEFPEHPSPTIGGRMWMILALVVMLAAGGALAWYNSRPETSEVPALAGMRQGEALNMAGSFKGVITEEASEDVAVGVVIRTEPEAGSTLENGKTLTIVVSTGPAPRPLPDVVGLTVADATAKLAESGLVLVEGNAAFSEDVPEGVVLSWTVPAAPGLKAGDTVVKGTTVQVVVSAGPAPRTVPDLTGKTLADATAAVQALGLVVAQGPDEFSDTVPAGQVLRQDVAAGTDLVRGATVTVVLSKGQDLVVFPDLNGQNVYQATATLQAAGLVVGSTGTGDGNQPIAGASVNGQGVVPGQQLPRGTKVDLTFPPTPVPTTTAPAP